MAKKREEYVRSVKVTTTISVENVQKFDKYNRENPDNRITWSQIIRRGFPIVLVENDKNSDYLQHYEISSPVVQNKISELSAKFAELANQLSQVYETSPSLKRDIQLEREKLDQQIAKREQSDVKDDVKEDVKKVAQDLGIPQALFVKTSTSGSEIGKDDL